MKYSTFYKNSFGMLKHAERELRKIFEEYKWKNSKEIVYHTSRIKSPDSMIEKLENKGYPVNEESALHLVHDVLGARIVCVFREDVFRVVRYMKSHFAFTVVKEKDYISDPKESGYRSYHLICRYDNKDGRYFYFEIQIRDMTNDVWAVIEHRINYKKNERYKGVIEDELKKCASSLATIDIMLSAIRKTGKE